VCVSVRGRDVFVCLQCVCLYEYESCRVCVCDAVYVCTLRRMHIHSVCICVAVCVCDLQCVCMQCVRELQVCVPVWCMSVMYMSRLHMSNFGYFYIINIFYLLFLM